MIEGDFGPTPNVLSEEYLDVYEGIHSEIVNTTRFDENSGWSTTYLGNQIDLKVVNLKQKSLSHIRTQYTSGKLLDGTEYQLLLDTGTSKLFMSKSFYMHCKSLHTLPKFASKTQRIQVGNGQFVSILFISPVIIDVHWHSLKIYTLVSEIHENVDLVLGIKNAFKLEGVINSWDCCVKFLNRSLPIFAKEHVIIEPKEQKLIMVTAPFIDESSSLAIIIILDVSTYSTMLTKLKFTCNTATLDVVNNGTVTIIFKLEEMIEIVDSRLLGYYKIKQGILHHNLSKYYRFERAETLCEYFNKIINIKERQRTGRTKRKLPMVRFQWWEKIHDRPGNIRQVYRLRKLMSD